MTSKHVLELARRMFERQTAGYDAEPALVELAWNDELIRDFWIQEVEALMADLEDVRAA